MNQFAARQVKKEEHKIEKKTDMIIDDNELNRLLTEKISDILFGNI